jgi:hypothetical protein
MGVGDFTAVSICHEPISPSRPAKISFEAVVWQMKGLHPHPQILRWLPRRSAFQPHKVCQSGQPSHLHSAFVRLDPYFKMGKALRLRMADVAVAIERMRVG